MAAPTGGNLGDIIKALFVGQGGAMMTPEELANQRLLLSKRMGTTDTSPVGHWSAGAARMVDALGDVFQQRRLDGVSRELAGEDKAAQGILGQIASGLVPGVSTGAAVPQAAAPAASPAQAATPTPYNQSGSLPSFARQGGSPDELRNGILQTAQAIGADPMDLATAISYETAGTFDPTKRGPSTQWGQHRGLIQFGEPQAKQYGVDWNNPMGSQLGADGAVAKYLVDRGFKPGMSGLDLYSTINAGSPGRYRASDANNGGAPGNVRDKWEGQMAGHRANAQRLLGDVAAAVAPAASAVAPTQAGTMASIRESAAADRASGALAPAVGSAASPSVQPASVVTQPPPAPQPATPAAPAANQIPQLLAMANNQRLAEGTRKIATSLLGQQMSAAKEAAERARTKAERTQAATVLGINPAYAANEDVWKSAVGEHFKTTTAAPGSSIVRGGQIVGSVPQAPMSVAPNTTVLDPNTRQPIFTAPSAPTPEMQNYQAQQQMPGFAAAQSQKRFDDAAVPQQVKMFGDVQTAGSSARSNVARIDVLDKLLAESPAGAPASMVAMAGRVGINLGKDSSNIQAANAIINQLVPAQREPGSGPMSDRDIELFRSSLPQLINTREGNQKIVSTMRAIAQYDVLRGNIANDVLNGRMSPSQGRDALMNLENPLASFQPARDAAPQGGQRRTSSGVTWSVN